MYNLTLSMIVKNEESNIERCIDSLAQYIDYYIGVDHSMEMLKIASMKYPEYNIKIQVVT